MILHQFEIDEWNENISWGLRNEFLGERSSMVYVANLLGAGMGGVS